MKSWCLPMGVDGEFIHRMEDELVLYAEPHDTARPVVCFDEASKKLRGDVAASTPPAPGSPAKQDYEYTRHGTANLFAIVEPLAGRRHVTLTDRRTIPDFAARLKSLCVEMYPETKVIRVVLDNLNTNALGSLFATYAPEEVWRPDRRLEFPFTPKHARSLNMAECELGVLSRQCLCHRLSSQGRWRRRSGHGRRRGSRPESGWCGDSRSPTPAGSWPTSNRKILCGRPLAGRIRFEGKEPRARDRRPRCDSAEAR